MSVPCRFCGNALTNEDDTLSYADWTCNACRKANFAKITNTLKDTRISRLEAVVESLLEELTCILYVGGVTEDTPNMAEAKAVLAERQTDDPRR